MCIVKFVRTPQDMAETFFLLNCNYNNSVFKPDWENLGNYKAQKIKAYLRDDACFCLQNIASTKIIVS